MLIQDRNPASRAGSEEIAADRLNELADTRNTKHRRIFLLSWADSDEEWLILEDEMPTVRLNISVRRAECGSVAYSRSSGLTTPQPPRCTTCV
jgi:hypothetical protein